MVKYWTRGNMQEQRFSWHSLRRDGNREGMVQKHAAAAGREQSEVDAGAQHLSLIPSGIRAV